jgi:hypothetical protein
MTSKQYLLKLQTRFISVFITAILVGALCYFVLQPANGMAYGQSLYFMMGFAATVFCLLLFMLLNKQKNQEATELPKLSDKLIAFQNNYLTSLSLLLGPCIVNFFLYGVGGPKFNYYLGLFFISLLITRFPRINLISNSLELKEKDIKSLNNENFKII